MWRRFFTRLSGHGSRCSRPWQKSLKKTSFAYDYSLQALVDLTTGQFLGLQLRWPAVETESRSPAPRRRR
jgi:hypothetical protein